MAKKRGNNEGSLYKRSNGSWRASVSIGEKRITKSFKLKRDAQNWIRNTLSDIDSGIGIENPDLILSDYLYNWLLSIESSIRYSTHKQYKQIINQHINPKLGKYKLRDIKPSQIQSIYNTMIKNGSSPRTVQIVHAVIHRSMEQAVKLGILAKNPAHVTTPPKPKHKEMNFYNEKEIQIFLSMANKHEERYFALFHLAISTGMRQGELLGLKWNDLNEANRTLQIQRQLIRSKEGGFIFSQPKTKSGIRKIILGNNTINVLKNHQKLQSLEKQFAGEKWQNNDLIFPSTIGTATDPNNLRKKFKRIIELSNLPKIRFHDLRHTAASLMLNNGIPVIIVSKRLGHAQPSITLDVYGHLIPSKQEEVASLMDALLPPQ